MQIYFFLLIIPSILNLHLKQQQKHDNKYQNIYLNNQELDNFANQLSINNTNNAYVDHCQIDQNIRYMHLGPNQSSIIIIVCNIHARQLITAQICLNWARSYLSQKTPNISITLFYIANRQRDLVTNYSMCIRKSASGVDMNRNYPTQFDFYKASEDFQSQIYPGFHPISQPFTICLNQIINQEEPLMFLDLHSGENGGLFYQQGYNSAADRDIFKMLNQQVCNQSCRITTLARDGEAINGHIFADLKVRLFTKYSLLIQAYGNNATNDCLQEFNPSTYVEKQKVINKWVDGINLIIRELRRRQNL